MTKILMVCLGNICRSPVAEGVMRHFISKKGINALVDSAGTIGAHSGEAPDKRSQLNALKHQIDISSLRARQFKVNDFDHFDVIYVMDNSNYQNVIKLCRSKKEEEKVKLLLEITHSGMKKEVPDPYYGNEADFEEVFQLISTACNAITENMKYT